jgi:hypothetical protein
MIMSKSLAQVLDEEYHSCWIFIIVSARFGPLGYIDRQHSHIGASEWGAEARARVLAYTQNTIIWALNNSQMFTRKSLKKPL